MNPRAMLGTWVMSGVWAVLMGVVCAAQIAPGEAPVATPMDRFVASVRSDAEVPEATRTLIVDAWESCGDCDVASLLIEGLTLLSPPFREAMDAYDAEEYGRCAELMAGLEGDADPFISAHATFYHIKALVSGEAYGPALKRLESLSPGTLDRIEACTYDMPEVEFLHGYCLLEDLQFARAAKKLQSFVDDYPDAPQRLVISAKQMLAEIMNRRVGRIGEVSDLMNFAANRLRGGQTGSTVQERQKRAVELLDKLIEDAEKREQNAAQSQSQGGSPRDRGGRAPQSPMERSQLPQAGKARMNLRQRQVRPGKAWGAMPPAQREQILQALRENFPGRYRRLVEQYYEQLAKEP